MNNLAILSILIVTLGFTFVVIESEETEIRSMDDLFSDF